jgi:hypothetical protein
VQSGDKRTDKAQQERLHYMYQQYQALTSSVSPNCDDALFVFVQSGDKRTDKAQQERLRNEFNLGVADCPVFANIFKYCQVGLDTVTWCYAKQSSILHY